MTPKSTTVSATSAMATALATGRGRNLLITLDDVRVYMDWQRDGGGSPSPVGDVKAEYIAAALNFLLSDDVPRA